MGFESDAMKRKQMVDELQRLHLENVTCVPLGHYRNVTAYRTTIKGIIPALRWFSGTRRRGKLAVSHPLCACSTNSGAAAMPSMLGRVSQGASPMQRKNAGGGAGRCEAVQKEDGAEGARRKR